MFLLRRTAVKAIASPASSFVIRSKATSSAPSAILRLQRQWALPSLQQRLYSAETKGEEQTSSAVEEPSIVEEQTSAEEQSSAIPSTSEQSSETPVTDALAEVENSTAAANSAPEKMLYVGNLFFEVNEEQLHKLFSPFGPLQQVKLICDNRGLSRGFGFVQFENVADAEAAIASLNQQTFEGRRMIVQEHKPKERNQNFTKPLVANDPSKTLFIGNMSFEMSDKDLNDLFRNIQNVVDVRVAIDRRTGSPRGFAHADFHDVQSAVKAKEVLDNKVVYGRGLRVDFSMPGNRGRNVR